MTTATSKSARKREYLALQALGEKLIEVPEHKLRDMPLDDELLEAILMAARMTSRSALRRQRQLIGKLMGRADGERIRAAYDALTRSNREQKAAFHQAEQWRDRIVNEGPAAAHALFTECQREDAALAALAREVHGNLNDAQAKRVRRQIFRRVHDLLAEA